VEKTAALASGTSAAEHVKHRASAPRAAGIAGLVFAVLYTASIMLLRYQPPEGSSAQAIADWYQGSAASNVMIFGLYMAPFAGIAFLWFIGVIRSRIGSQEDQFLATVLLGSGLIFVALFFASAACAGAFVAAAKFQNAPTPGPDSIVYARSLAYALLFIYGMKAAAVFMISVSTFGLRVSILPRWVIFSGYLIALVLLFFVTYLELIALFFPAWVAVVSILILIGGHAKKRQPSPA